MPELLQEKNVFLRMQDEIKEALRKPVEERNWVMVIDFRKCTGCHSCTIACVAENKLPPGVVYRPVIEQEKGKYPNVRFNFIPRPCMQCRNAPCVSVCPVNATWTRPDGITEIDYEKCIGCRYCITACPYSARTFDLGHTYTEDTPEQMEYETLNNFEYNKEWPRKNNRSPVGNVRKCHFCLHRLEQGLLPTCVTTCIGLANYFGDSNNPYSLVAELMYQPNAIQLKAEKGTDPRVYYLL